jgi:hypothetical protein
MAEMTLAAGVKFAGGMAMGLAQGLIGGLFARDRQAGPRHSELEVQTSTQGAGIPIVYGRMRVAGQVIWAARFKEHERRERTGGKGGGPSTVSYSYSVSFAVGIAEGPISGVGRVWANGAELDLSRANMRVHLGTEDQQPDPLIEAVEGAGMAPGHRGLAYAVFEDFPLDEYGARIPSLSFEVIAPAGGSGPRMDALIEGVCLIPASGEFAYATGPVTREAGPGREIAENVHTLRADSDVMAALDDLEARLPNCRSVALVTAWMGTDLRCADCEIVPGVETRTKTTRPLEWRAAGLDRQSARLVSQSDGGPVYGGTPSDATVIELIRELKRRGMKVALYPFILMDVPPGNGLEDPYGGDEQAAFPWRGRITCHPAPGMAGSPDGSAAAAEQVADFFGQAQASDFEVSDGAVDYGGPGEWRFRRFILHHAALASAAGGVDAFLIGSEMRELTRVMGEANSFPAVEALRTLAGEARALLGPGTRLSYAADWSEYFGHAPGNGDRFFHLDPLWADAEIDFVGIDWYAPLSDWREGTGHLDALAGAASIYDRDYLAANVEGGEGHDWFYAGAADRQAQTRTPITDGDHGEPWVWRYKDLRGWWQNAHHERIGGERMSQPTAWIPRSKPVAFIELGCPAVDKGANQPNVFIDPKSSESFAPHHSNGRRDDLIQRRYVEALLDHWSLEGGRNPVSPLYGGPMLDLSLCHVWTWDARPYPEFPARGDVWKDGENWRLGHWLTGRAGQSPLAAIVEDVCARAGLAPVLTEGLEGVLAGFVIERPRRAREVLGELSALFGFDLVDRADGTAALPRRTRADAAVDLDNAVRDGGGPVWELSRRPLGETPKEARIGFVEDGGDYRGGTAHALGLDGQVEGRIEVSAPVLADPSLAQDWARGVLVGALAEGDGLSLTLPPSLSFLEAGDVVLTSGGAKGVWRIGALDGLASREAALAGASGRAASVAGPQGGVADPEGPPPPARPVLACMDLPLGPEEGEARGGLVLAAWADPWPGPLTVHAGTEMDLLDARAEITRPSVMGELIAPLSSGPEGRWDRAGAVAVRLYSGALESVEPRSALAGANLLAVEGEAGWEVIGFARAELEAPGLWRLSELLRGLGGSPAEGAPAGARAVVLRGDEAVLPLRDEEADEPLSVVAVPRGRDVSDVSARTMEAVYRQADRAPLSPVHLKAERLAEGWRLSWVRRTRIDGDGWSYGEVPLGEASERYRVRLIDGQGAELGDWLAENPWLEVADAALPEDLGGAVWAVAQLSGAAGPGREARGGFAA